MMLLLQRRDALAQFVYDIVEMTDASSRRSSAHCGVGRSCPIECRQMSGDFLPPSPPAEPSASASSPSSSSPFLLAPFLFLFALHHRVLWILALTSNGPSLLRWYNLSPISIPHGISGIPID